MPNATYRHYLRLVLEVFCSEEDGSEQLWKLDKATKDPNVGGYHNVNGEETSHRLAYTDMSSEDIPTTWIGLRKNRYK